MAIVRKQYSDEFKRNAVDLSSQMGTMNAAKDLGIPSSTLVSWRRWLRVSGKKATSLKPVRDRGAQKRSYEALEKENKRIKKENGYLREVNAVLKKSAAILLGDQMRGS